MYLPGSHDTHVVEVEYLPVEQVPQEADPASETWPAGQFVQSVLPAPDAYVPAEQEAHSVAPSDTENLPATQFVQIRSGFEYFPATQEEQLEAPPPEEVPTGQNVHWLDPATAASLPAGQLSQTMLGAPSSDVLPAGHRAHAESPVDEVYFPAAQLAQVEEPEVEIFPTEQSAQVDADVAPVLGDAVPSGHAVHIAAAAPL
jgi:hypothetical protein